MSDEYLKGMMDRVPLEAQMHLQYSEYQLEQRARLIELIEAEKRAYFERIEPHLQALQRIDAQAIPTFVIKTGLR